jgi:hypothetical protein
MTVLFFCVRQGGRKTTSRFKRDYWNDGRSQSWGDVNPNHHSIFPSFHEDSVAMPGTARARGGSRSLVAA